ncbi:ankyrin repeat domain-containing protein [Dyadobacter bucti]|uniref:ankyrin repeat domain-containing protein n=1 Tax=Dyadobacter bucti TaxID=2572203 RepID=UPI001109F158|nr:ankyrin repeat domain-containing protein [Dyadobacter bucti]
METSDVTPIENGETLTYFENRAQKLFESCRAVDTTTIQHVRKYHPDPAKLAELNKPVTHFEIGDARLVVAREHGFESWEVFCSHVQALSEDNSVVKQFERAADAIVSGDIDTLATLLSKNPALTKIRSDRMHKATLLHYIAANGVENFRQHSPGNAVDICKMLLKAGAEVDALAEVYNGNHGSTLDLLVSSVHPAKAGVQAALVEVLLDFGASVDGVWHDGSPLITALAFHYADAAETLARRGAAVDNIVVAAGLGRDDLVESFLEPDGSLKRGVPLLNVPWIPVNTPAENLKLALVWAAMHNRNHIVELLLSKGVDPASSDKRGWTALHWAAFNGYADTVQLLIDGKAPLEAHNEYGGTVLDQAVWVTSHGELDEAHLDVIQLLVNCGAKIHGWWLLNSLHPPLDDRVIQILEAGKK